MVLQVLFSILVVSLAFYHFQPSTMEDELIIDGSIMEGGGQILRMAMSLGALTQKRLRVVNVRSGRDVPGLRPQHLKAIELLIDMAPGSRYSVTTTPTCTVELVPSTISSGTFLAPCQTSGSISLIIQAAFPVAAFGPNYTQLKVEGGTNTHWAPPVDYLQHVFLHLAEKFGVKSDLLIRKRGFYPKGGGYVELNIYPIPHLNPVHLIDQGTVTNIWAIVVVSFHFNQKVHKVIDKCKSILSRDFPSIRPTFQVEKFSLPLPVAGMCVFAETSTGCRLGASRLLRKGEDVIDMGSLVAEDLASDIRSGGCLDQYAQDQVIVLMALAKGESVVKVGRLTAHTKTAIHIAQQVTKASFQVTPSEDNTNFITCQGVGFVNSQFKTGPLFKQPINRQK